MNPLKFFFNKARGNKGQNLIWIPPQKASALLKSYYVLLDVIFNMTSDFAQIVGQLNEFLPKPKIQINSSSLSDSYRVLSFMETSLNHLDHKLEHTIQFEYRTREDILKLEKIYFALTTFPLTENQQAELLKFEQVHKDSFIAKATTERTSTIVEGHNSTQKILISENAVHPHTVQKEADTLELAELKSAHFKTVSGSDQKEFFHRKINEYPTLTKPYMSKAQISLDSIKELKNGMGTPDNLEMVHAESDIEINNSQTQN